MSRPERVGRLLRQIEHETQVAFDEHTELFNLNNQLKAENAKLWELITDVHESLKADKAGMFHSLTLLAMEDDMRELGVEVDG